MWLLVMFDLPVLTQAERKAAANFRHVLLDLGFEMTQFSVYMRFCTSPAHAETLCGRIETPLPPGGRVHVLQFTDKQYERARIYRGRQRQRGKKSPGQFELF
jgi:CRISPR-associated protein Cas2